MKPIRIYRFLLAGFFLLVLFSIGSAFASSLIFTSNNNNISYSHSVPTANDLKPAACTMYISNIITSSGTINGTSGNDLIFGSSGNDTINGLGGNDCIFGLAGDDTIDGGDGTADICVEGTGTNTSTNCETVTP